MQFIKAYIVKFSILILGVCVVTWLAPDTQAVAMAAAVPSAATDTVIVQFPESTTIEERDQAVAELGGVLTGWIAPLRLARIQLIQPTREPVDHPFINSRTNVMPTFVECETLVTGTYAPNDPDYYDSGKSYALPTIGIESAWDSTIGNPNIIIAIIDTGINSRHPEFVDRLVAGYDFVHDDDDPDDDHGHGTHVAGIVAAAIDNGQGTAGVCPGCSLMPIKVLNENNAGTWFNAAQGIVYAVDHGAHIINLSLGSTSNSDTIATAVDYAISQGVLVVAAAGNEGSSAPFYPAAYDEVLAVSANEPDDTLWPLSNHGEYVDVAAPGYLVYSTDRQLDNAYGGYSFKSGTSMAAPHVAGLAGLLLSQDAERTPADLTQIITESALDLGAAGWDAQFGYGRIDAGAALEVGRTKSQNDASGADKSNYSIFVPVAARG